MSFKNKMVIIIYNIAGRVRVICNIVIPISFLWQGYFAWDGSHDKRCLEVVKID